MRSENTNRFRERKFTSNQHYMPAYCSTPEEKQSPQEVMGFFPWNSCHVITDSRAWWCRNDKHTHSWSTCLSGPLVRDELTRLLFDSLPTVDSGVESFGSSEAVSFEPFFERAKPNDTWIKRIDFTLTRSRHRPAVWKLTRVFFISALLNALLAQTVMLISASGNRCFCQHQRRQSHVAIKRKGRGLSREFISLSSDEKQ